MNFTREPIIETVITPREGCKLVVRSSKGVSQEDYFVDAVEVVSFGHSFFFRSQERPKSFLVPVNDYEILELRETRMVLKNVATDRSIKIGGGREAPPRHREEEPASADTRPGPQQGPQQSSQQDQSQQGQGRKRDKRRRGRRGRDRDNRQEMREAPQESGESFGEDRPSEDLRADEGTRGAAQPQGEEKAPSFISKLFPPPPTLIKESLTRYKNMENGEERAPKEKPPQDETSFEPFTDFEGEPEDENEE